MYLLFLTLKICVFSNQFAGVAFCDLYFTNPLNGLHVDVRNSQTQLSGITVYGLFSPTRFVGFTIKDIFSETQMLALVDFYN